MNLHGIKRANVQKAPGHGHFLEMKNSAYHCPYDLVDNKVNAIYIVYKVRDYDSTGTEHNYLFSCGTSDNHHGVCFLKDERNIRVYGLDRLNHIIDATFSNIEQFERFDRYTILQSLYTALDHQVEDGLMRQQESDCMRFIVGKL